MFYVGRSYFRLNGLQTRRTLTDFAGECFSCFLSSLIFLNQLFKKKKKIQIYHQSVKQFGSRSGPTFCRPDLPVGPNCLQMLSAADDTGTQKVITNYNNASLKLCISLEYEKKIYILFQTFF